MSEFMTGWRRKTGIVTLALALLFSAGWVRSFTTRDVYSFVHDGSMITFRSFQGGLGGQRFSPSGWMTSTGWSSDHNFKFSWIDPWWRLDNFDDADIEWRWDWAGFSFGSAVKKDPPILRNLNLWIVPYWAIVSPLVLVSAYLLLGKPRRLSPPSADDEEATL